VKVYCCVHYSKFLGPALSQINTAHFFSNHFNAVFPSESISSFQCSEQNSVPVSNLFPRQGKLFNIILF
jgi:hypothetical protein